MTDAPPRIAGSYLVVELTNRCSLRCVHCAVSDPSSDHHRTTGHMSTAHFEALIDDLVDSGAAFDTLILFWLGEPLLHPAFTRLWRTATRAAARHRVFQHIEVHTNATHLDARTRAALLNDGPVRQTLLVGIDAVTPATYQAIKGRDRLATVTTHTRALLEDKARRGARWPRPIVQFVVGSNNAAEAAAFRDTWVEAAQQVGLPVQIAAGHVPRGEDFVVFFRQLDCPTAAEQLREDQVFHSVTADLGVPVPAPPPALRAESNRSPCSAFWKSPTLDWRGQLTTCTRDLALDNRVGSLDQGPFHALWWGPEMSRRRAAVARADYATLPLCQTCFVPQGLNHSDIDPADIARLATWEARRG